MREFEEIYENYAKDVFRYLLVLTKEKALAEEFTQEVFYRGIKNIEKFKGNSSMYSWLCGIGRNIYYDYLKERKNIDLNNDILEEIREFNTPESIVSEDEESYELYKAIDELEEPGRSVLKLHLIDGISLKNISNLYGKSESFGRVVYHRTRVKLKERLEKNEKRV
ncbi:MAG: RNA polymerase sigma factor [Clostridium sp.]|uniref:RNA polymerase sigma factor n=1 Tax=Clostridium sp. TaxID=1506 RepID=UPI003F32A609